MNPHQVGAIAFAKPEQWMNVSLRAARINDELSCIGCPFDMQLARWCCSSNAHILRSHCTGDGNKPYH